MAGDGVHSPIGTHSLYKLYLGTGREIKKLKCQESAGWTGPPPWPGFCLRGSILLALFCKNEEKGKIFSKKKINKKKLLELPEPSSAIEN